MASTSGMLAEEQQEQLRRFVDEWRSRVSSKNKDFQGQNLEAVLNDSGNAIGNIISDPLRINPLEPADRTPLLHLVHTNNVLFNKLITVLSYDCIEITRLHKQACKKFFPQLLGFGLPMGPEELVLEGEPQKLFGRSLLFFQELSEFLGKLKAILGNLLCQLEAIYSGDNKSKLYPSFLNVHLQSAILHFAVGFSIVVIIDDIVSKNPAIAQAISLFIRMLYTISNEPSHFAMESKQLESLGRVVTDIEVVLQVGLFQRFLKLDFMGHLQMEKLKSNRQFVDELSLSLHKALSEILSRLDTLKERPKDRIHLVGLLAVFMFHSSTCVEIPDRKMGKLIIEVVRRAPILHVYPIMHVQTLDFLLSLSPPSLHSWSVLKDLRKETGSLRSNFLTNMDDNLIRDVQGLQNMVASWFTTFESTSSNEVKQEIHTNLRSQSRQLVQGIQLARRLQHIIRATLDMHVIMEVPIKKDQSALLFQGVALLKAVEDVYHRRCNDTAQIVSQILHLLQCLISRRLLPLKAQVEAEFSGKSRTSSLSFLALTLTRSGKDMDTKVLDLLASVNLALQMLLGIASEKRRVILGLCLDVIFSLQHVLQDEVQVKVEEFMSEIDIIADISTAVENSTDCSFLYARREMISTWFPMMYAQAERALQLQYILSAFCDGIRLLKRGNTELMILGRYEDELELALIKDVIKPLCRDIETDLRLHVHSAHMKGSVTVNPTKTGVRDLSWFLCIEPLRLSSKYVHIKSRIEMYLNEAFYNHTAMALHNWKTYSEMRHVAEQKYGLVLDDIHLPGHTLEQGVDVLNIMRNIHIFVSCYTYNLNTQVFIERVSKARDRKYLNTISVKHIANSIRTHGTGIMSTTVNFTYQFLAQKFIVFSQFLYDDHIKSRLVKEYRFYKECRDKSKEYPVVRAEKLNKEIKKLGAAEDGMSFLDQFRQLISEIGNALGFVRMVRMGGLQHSSTASGFVQGKKSQTTFEEAARLLNMNAEAVKAGVLLDRTLEQQGMPVEQMNYFRILIEVFSEELRSADNLHLKEFYLILPALIMNAVEMMLQSKDKLLKKGRESLNALFTDDGLVLGLAYILKVLNQDKQFDSLHWFESATRHFSSERKRLQDGLNMDTIESGLNGLQVWSQKFASLSKDEVQNMQLVIKRTESVLTEMELMQYNFIASRILF